MHDWLWKSGICLPVWQIPYKWASPSVALHMMTQLLVALRAAATVISAVLSIAVLVTASNVYSYTGGVAAADRAEIAC